MRIIDVEANSEEWFEKRRGRSSSSRVKNVLVDKYVGKTEAVAHLVNQGS